MFVLALIALLATGEPATPAYFKAYPSLKDCMAVAQMEADNAQRSLDSTMGKGAGQVFANCVEVRVAGQRV